MLDAVVPAALEHVECTGDVAADVGVRLLERIAHAGLGGQVHHARETLAREQRAHRRLVRDVELLEAESAAAAAGAPGAPA